MTKIICFFLFSRFGYEKILNCICGSCYVSTGQHSSRQCKSIGFHYIPNPIIHFDCHNPLPRGNNHVPDL